VPMKGFEPEKAAVQQTLVFRKSAAPLAAKLPPPAEKPKWVNIELGSTGVEQLKKAIIAMTIRKYADKPNAPQMLFGGDGSTLQLQFWGDAEAIRWVTELVENLKK